jgi:glycosyltransferase involved in cell wall biosynthesis
VPGCTVTPFTGRTVPAGAIRTPDDTLRRVEICTIAARNYLASARVLARSFLEHHPGGRCWTLVIDDLDEEIDAASEPFEVVRPGDLSIEPWARMVAAYSVLELSTAVKPWLLRTLLGERGLERVTYLDPDIQFFGSIADVDELLRAHSVVVIPHLTAPMPRDGRRPSETDILVSGSFNLGFGGFALLDWWGERLETDCVVAPERGYFVDQRWMDFAPGLVPSLHVLRDPGYNVAYWNLPTRKLAREDGGVSVDGRPLRFFHFSGYDPSDPGRLSKHQDRIELGAHPLLRELCDNYAAALREEGHEQWRLRPYRYDSLPDGTPLDGAARAAYRAALATGELRDEEIFSSEGGAAFSAHLRAAAPRGGHRGVSNYLLGLWTIRPDIQAVFPEPRGPDGSRLASWAREHPEEVPPTFLELTGAGGPEPLSVQLAGYLAGVMGTGEHARQLAQALRTQGVSVATTVLHPEASPEDERLAAGAQTEGSVEPAFNLLAVNADSVPRVATSLGRDFFSGRYTIGFWAWEVSAFPARFLSAFEHVDEVWVGSRHVRDAITALSPVPVIAIPQPVSLAPSAPPPFELPGAFNFLFAFDYLSIFERKNPLAVIDAFTRAFPPGQAAPEQVALTIKCLNGELSPDAHARLRAAAAAHPNVHLLERRLEAQERDGLMAAADCYVSLHRAEGFGYTLAETMWLGKPVIATGYSGNVDFMTPENSYLVDHGLVTIGPGNDPYPPDGVWAEPDVDHAARLMREVFEDPEAARRRGQRAAEDIRLSHGPKAAGRAMADRLRVLQRAGATNGVRGRGWGQVNTARLSELIHGGPRAPAHPRFGTSQRVARKGLLRLLKPVTVHERMVDHELLCAIEALEARLRVIGENQDYALRQIDELRAQLATHRSNGSARYGATRAERQADERHA